MNPTHGTIVKAIKLQHLFHAWSILHGTIPPPGDTQENQERFICSGLGVANCLKRSCSQGNGVGQILRPLHDAGLCRALTEYVHSPMEFNILVSPLVIMKLGVDLTVKSQKI